VRALVGLVSIAGVCAAAGSAAGVTLSRGERGIDAGPTAEPAVAFAVSKPLRELAAAPTSARAPAFGVTKFEAYLESRLAGAQATPPGGGAPDPVVQRALGAGTIPAPSTSFEGIPQTIGTIRPIPPDTVGEIGPNHYVQMVNLRYAVFDRQGRLLVGPLPTNTLFGPLGDICGVTNEGDPIVLYDQLADRWLLSQFGFLANQSTSFPRGPYYECVAVSKTGDPTGAYFLYAFKINDTKLNDYPKLGVWPDAYYLSMNQFFFGDSGQVSYGSAGVAALERERMLAGDPGARIVYFDLERRDPNLGGMLPSDLDGFRLPPTGAANTFIEVDFPEFGFPTDQLTIFQFHVDWVNTAASAFTGPVAVPTAPFDPLLCNFSRACIPQKGSFQRLDAISDRLMHRLAYRNFGTHESLVVNHSVDTGGDHAGIRWYEIRNPRGGPFIHQQGTFAPDADHRWMGSIAMDGNGNAALGYSVSGSNLFPSIRYTGRLADDPPGLMTLGEATLVAGSGAQTHPAGRWGDYSAMSVDPLDDCTFWYTQEYYTETTDRTWRTRVGAFTYPECDTTDPESRARASSGRTGKTVRLRYSVTDNKGETSETVTVLRPNGKRLRTITTELGPATGAVESVSFKAPGMPGTYRFCVVAEDPKGNESAESCARLRLRA
jgi:hypothetical protein